jgi:short-subunit dehydrogenase
MPYALITGSAKGIGAAIAVEMARKGFDLFLVDIDGAGLENTKSKIGEKRTVAVHTLQLDLSSPDCAKRISEWTSQHHNELNVVINNAGYGLNGAFEKLSIEEHENIIDVNIKAQLKIAHAFIPVLRKFNRSYLLNVGSTTCFQSVPFMSIYAASKAFVISFTRSLRFELKDSPVSVSCLIPGSTDTDFVNRARMNEHARKTATRYYMTPESVAKIAIAGMFKGKSEIIPGVSNKLHSVLPKFFPKTFVEKIAGNIYRPREKQIESE